MSHAAIAEPNHFCWIFLAASVAKNWNYKPTSSRPRFFCKGGCACSSLIVLASFQTPTYAKILLRFLFSFLELSRPLARHPGAGRLGIEGFAWVWDPTLRRKCGPGPWVRARVWAWPGPMHSSSMFGPKPIRTLQFPASQPLEAALAPD